MTFIFAVSVSAATIETFNPIKPAHILRGAVRAQTLGEDDRASWRGHLEGDNFAFREECRFQK